MNMLEWCVRKKEDRIIERYHHEDVHGDIPFNGPGALKMGFIKRFLHLD